MRVDISKYLEDRFHEELRQKEHEGPVITISRETGCPAKSIANKLTEALSNMMHARGEYVQWKVITKEILSESAKILHVDPSQIKYVFDCEQKSVIDDILASHFNKYYKSDRRIRTTIARVIKNIAREGHVVIVGRGGVAITHTIKKSLHIGLEAPMDWRVSRISAQYEMSLDAAKKYLIDIDKKRKQFRDFFENRNKNENTSFDIIFNCMTFTEEEIVSVIVKAAETRKLIIR